MGGLWPASALVGAASYGQGASFQAGIHGFGPGCPCLCLKGFRKFHIQNEGDLVRWLSRIADNRLRDNLDRLHADKRDIRKEVALGGYESTTGGRLFGAPGLLDTTTPSAIMSKREEFDKLAKAIDTLKPEYREVIILAKIEGLSYKEIADKLGKNSDAVRKLASRAMTALIGAFEEI